MRSGFRLTLLSAAVLAACSTLSPETAQRVDEARGAYHLAASDPQVQRHAQPELARAASALQDAERMAKEGADAQLVEHHAYLAERRARTAVTVAQAREAETRTVIAREEQRRQRLEAEAATAREEAKRADVARQEAEARARLAEEEKLKVVREQTATAELAAEVKKLEAQYPGVQARQTTRGWVVTLNNDLLFDSGAALKDDADRTLDNVAEFLRKHPERRVAIEGFTDGAGPRDAAERLSERRAQAVKFALVQRGVEPHRIDARGYGGAFPVSSNDSETGRHLNRRVEIVINPS
jgi:outer membrane protein OmpA-like peptidoglycan-associated protein